MERFLRVVNTLDPCHQESSGKRIKVAILVTGFDLDQLQEDLVERLVDVKDFTNDDTEAPMKDPGGFGTSLSAILLYLAPYAHLHIAKVGMKENIVLRHVAEVN